MRKYNIITAMFLFITSSILVACGGGGGGSSSSAPDPAQESGLPDYSQISFVSGSWTQGIPYLGSDNCLSNTSANIFVTNNAYVFTNGADENAVKAVATFVEQELASLASNLSISLTDVGISPSSKLYICADTQIMLYGAIGTGSSYGLSVQSPDSDYIPSSYLSNNFSEYRKLVKHELTHTIQSRYMPNSDAYSHVWFIEGMASYLSDQAIVSTLSEFNQWFADGNINPLLSVNFGDVPNSAQADYYSMYSLAVKYLVTPVSMGGAGNTYANIISMMTDAESLYQSSDPTPLETAFANNITNNGVPMTYAQYRDNFQVWMESFLP